MSIKPLFNLLEPKSLVEAFVNEPPEDFLPQRFETENGHCYGFVSKLDLFTTVSENLKTLRQKYQKWFPQWIVEFLQPRVLFIGTPVSEYALLPGLLTPNKLQRLWQTHHRKVKTAFLIVKDLPRQSPLLTEQENAFSEELLSHLETEGFLILSGQALGYVHIDFDSREGYLQKFSSKKRNNLKRKLKLFSKVSVKEIRTGDSSISQGLLESLYELYLNVYNNSIIHFDKLTLGFFKEVLTDSTNQGVILLFYAQEKLIGFSLSFHYQDYLVEKYIGCLYPDSREHNFYFLNWFYKLDYCLKHGLQKMIVGWTNPEIKAQLGAEFTQTYHAIYISNPLVRWLGQRIKPLFESDRQTLERIQNAAINN